MQNASLDMQKLGLSTANFSHVLRDDRLSGGSISELRKRRRPEQPK
ncbi:MAG: hypothetical protein R3E58_08560 [Phycisphaerae bacterium]